MHACARLFLGFGRAGGTNCRAVNVLVLLFSTARKPREQQQQQQQQHKHVRRLMPSSRRSMYVSLFYALFFVCVCVFFFCLVPPIVVTGSRLLPSMFISQVTLPLALHAVAEIENAPLADVGTEENILNRATRMARSWQQLQNGSFTARQQRAFQRRV